MECHFCGELATGIVQEWVVLESGEMFSRRVPSCAACSTMRRTALALDDSWMCIGSQTAKSEAVSVGGGRYRAGGGNGETET